MHTRNTHINYSNNKVNSSNNEAIPAKCKLKIAKSTAAPAWNSPEDNGGYTVQPVPAPESTKQKQVII